MLEMLISVVFFLLAMTKNFQKQEKSARNRNHTVDKLCSGRIELSKKPSSMCPTSSAGLNYCGALCETDCTGPNLGMDKDNN